MLEALRVVGPFHGPSGYDHHVREFVRELVRQGVVVQLIDMPMWSPSRLPEPLQDPWFDTLSAPVDAAITLHFTMPEQVIPADDTLNVNYTMFEASRVPAHWIEHNLRHDLIVVPTEFSRRTWIESGYPADRVRVSPLGINVALFASDPEPMVLMTEQGRYLSDYRSRFLNVSEVGGRKNLDGLLTAWLRATRADDDAILMMKMGPWVPGQLDVLQEQMRRIQQWERRWFEDAAPVEILFDVLHDVDMPRLYASATHYISLSHGEGWDQAMVEAAASGLQLIAPDHSAYPTYLTPSTATLIPSREIPADHAGNAWAESLFAGLHWWEPDLRAAVKVIRDAIDGRAPHWHGARAHVLANLTWEQATRQLIDVLSDLELAELFSGSIAQVGRHAGG